MAKPTETKPVTPPDKLDLSKPVFVVARQAPTRNIFTVFDGPDAKDNALAEASLQAAHTKSNVAVFGPQTNVFAPPAPVAAQAMTLDWVGGDPDQA